MRMNALMMKVMMNAMRKVDMSKVLLKPNPKA